MVMERLPLTTSGHPSSIGSLMHADGACRPCRSILLGQDCPRGFRCRFCHLEHSTLSCLLQPGSSRFNEDNRSRPSKAKRDRYKEIVQQMEADILQDPFGWNPESVQVPVELSRKPDVKQKLLIRLATTAERAR